MKNKIAVAQAGARKAKLRMEQATEHYHETRNVLLANLKGSPTGAEKKSIIEQLDECEREYAQIRNAFRSGRIESDYIKEERRRAGAKPRAPRTSTATDPQQGGWVDIYDDDPRPSKEEREAARDLRDVLQSSQRHPFKTNDRRDDMRYQTHGVRNHRAKRTF